MAALRPRAAKGRGCTSAPALRRPPPLGRAAAGGGRGSRTSRSRVNGAAAAPRWDASVTVSAEEAEDPALVQQLKADAEAVVVAALQAAGVEGGGVAELCVSLVADDEIADLNARFRGVDAPTDVLSFEVGAAAYAPPELAEEEEEEEEELIEVDDDELEALLASAADDDEYEYVLVDDDGELEEGEALGSGVRRVLGDVVVSADTARRQAEANGHALRDELRVLLAHGVLHLLGLDHERGPEDAEEMARLERETLAGAGFGEIRGLVDTQGTGVHERKGRRQRPRLVLLDMDGTLLDGTSRVREPTARAVRAALDDGVVVCLATGKTRVAALRVCDLVGLAGAGGLVDAAGPGVFTQGLVVYGAGGALVRAASLPRDVVSEAFGWAAANGVPLTAFRGDECATLAAHPNLDRLHGEFFEPPSDVQPTLEKLLDGPATNKLLFYPGDQDFVVNELRPHFERALAGRVSITQATPGMLEILPLGGSKGAGVEELLASLDIAPEEALAVGDGENDLEMLRLVGTGVAVANAVDALKAEADHVTASSNDEDGVAEALERFVL